MTSFVGETLDAAEGQVLSPTRLVLCHHAHALDGMLSHAVEEVVHYAWLSGNTHVNLLDNVLVVAARGEEESSKHREEQEMLVILFLFTFIVFIFS